MHNVSENNTVHGKCTFIKHARRINKIGMDEEYCCESNVHKNNVFIMEFFVTT